MIPLVIILRIHFFPVQWARCHVGNFQAIDVLTISLRINVVYYVYNLPEGLINGYCMFWYLLNILLIYCTLNKVEALNWTTTKDSFTFNTAKAVLGQNGRFYNLCEIIVSKVERHLIYEEMSGFMRITSQHILHIF